MNRSKRTGLLADGTSGCRCATVTFAAVTQALPAGDPWLLIGRSFEKQNF